MAFRDFLKKFGSFEGQEESETISFDSVNSWVEKKKTEALEKEEKIISNIKDQTRDFKIEIIEKVEMLKSFDLDSMRENERYKIIVRKHREDYIDNVLEFLENLKSLELGDKFENLIERVNKIFFTFEKKSRVNYERATILIGNEMAKIRQSIISLSKYFKQIFKDNIKLIELNRGINFVLLRLEELESLDKNSERLKGEIKSLEKEIKKTEEKKMAILERLSEIKNSKEYLENLEKKKKLNDLKKEIEKDVLRLKMDINFKNLANFFHKSEKEMGIIRKYRDNFSENFNFDEGEEIIGLLRESNQMERGISSQINKIKDEKEKSREIEKSICEDIILPLSGEVERLEESFKKFEDNKEKTKKIIENFSLKRQDLISQIRSKLSGFVVLT